MKDDETSTAGVLASVPLFSRPTKDAGEAGTWSFQKVKSATLLEAERDVERSHHLVLSAN